MVENIMRYRRSNQIEKIKAARLLKGEYVRDPSENNVRSELRRHKPGKSVSISIISCQELVQSEYDYHKIYLNGLHKINPGTSEASDQIKNTWELMKSLAEESS